MDKFGSVHGTEHNSAVLELNGLTHDIERRWGVNDIKVQALPTDKMGLRLSKTNFLTRWSSHDGNQQIGIVFLKMPSAFDNQPIVWTKIKSNGNLPNKEMLKEVLASLLTAGAREIASPERRWGVARDQLSAGNDLSHIFGGPVPAMHVHANNEVKS